MSLGRRRRDDSADSIEEVERHFPPRPNITVREGAGRVRSAGCYRHNGDDYYARSRDQDVSEGTHEFVSVHTVICPLPNTYTP